jgi:ribonuclease HI
MNEMIEIYTDGSSLGNPGPGGWGTVVVRNDSIMQELGGCEKETTNNRMELKGVIEALKYINAKHPKDTVVIHADSAYVLGGVTTWIHSWEKNGWRKSDKKEVLNQDLWKELIALVRSYPGTLSWQKVKGHAGHIYNEKADEIATGCSASQENHIL